MNRFQLQQAWRALLSTKLRSGLAMLGILIATASIVALLSCSLLATEKALSQFQSLGTNLITISLFQTKGSGSGSTPAISIANWRHLPQHITAIQNIAPYATTDQPVSFEGHPLHASIIGADHGLSDIIHITLASGRFVSSLDAYEQVCVIGDGLAARMKQLHYVHPIGQHVRIGNLIYTIIGVAEPWTENIFFNENINQAVIVPLAGIRLLDKNTPLNGVILRIADKAPIEQMLVQIRQWVHQEAPKVSIFIRSAKQIIDSMKNQGHIFTILLGVIGSIALLVGGIGIMNVMLISVSERKKEIGIRKAIGASKSDIQQLFLIESLLLSLCGGLLGLGLGSGTTWIIAYFNHWPFHLLFTPLAIGFGISVCSGVFFGFYPAHRAANLQAIESLRSD